MAIAGSWLAGNLGTSQYAGATRWGTGINPIHAIRDEGPGRGPTKEPLGSTAPSDAVDPSLADPALYGFEGEDTQFYVGEDYRYLHDDHANWGDTTVGRADRGPVIMEPGREPDPTGFPSWGPYNDDNPVDGFPVAGPPGGADVRANSQGAEIENAHAIAVPSGGVSGGWLNKAHGEVAYQVDSAPSQLLVTTSEVQGDQTRVNTAAVTRATDDARSPIGSRHVGQKMKVYGMSSGMGGGPGTPDMLPVTQDLPYRPWFYRTAGTPPPPDTTYGTMTGFDPIQRVPPVDAGELVTTTETGQMVDSAAVQGGTVSPTTGFDAGDGDYYA